MEKVQFLNIITYDIDVSFLCQISLKLHTFYSFAFKSYANPNV